MKWRVLKYLFLLITLTIQYKSYSQYSIVSNIDTNKIVQTAILDFIKKNIDSLKVANLLSSNKKIREIISYSIIPDISYSIILDSKAEYSEQYLFKRDPAFIDFIYTSIKDTSFRHWQNKKRKIQFIPKDKTEERANIKLNIFGLLRYQNNIYVKTTILSLKENEDMSVTAIYFFFDSNLRLINVRVYLWVI